MKTFKELTENLIFLYDRDVLNNENTTSRQPTYEISKLHRELVERFGAKFCTRCHQIKHITRFNVGNGFGGKTTYCRDCTKEIRRNGLKLKQERVSEHSQKPVHGNALNAPFTPYERIRLKSVVMDLEKQRDLFLSAINIMESANRIPTHFDNRNSGCGAPNPSNGSIIGALDMALGVVEHHEKRIMFIKAMLQCY